MAFLGIDGNAFIFGECSSPGWCPLPSVSIPIALHWHHHLGGATTLVVMIAGGRDENAIGFDDAWVFNQHRWG